MTENVWFLIANTKWWKKRIKDGFWDLQNPESRDMKYFKLIEKNDIILAYYVIPGKSSICRILRTSEGFHYDDKLYKIGIKEIYKLKNPITYKDFKELDILTEYQKMPRRSVVPVEPYDWLAIKKIIYELDNWTISEDTLIDSDNGTSECGKYLVNKANIFRNENNYDKALEYVDIAIEIEPENEKLKSYRINIFSEMMERGQN